MMSSDEILVPILGKRFNLLQADLNSSALTQSLIDVIGHLQVEGVKVVSIAGGAASGKSTLSHDLIAGFAELGQAADVLATDDYVRNDRAWRWENFEGKEDVDQRGKYDFELLNHKLDAVRHNTESVVAVPTYNQETGLAAAQGEANYVHKVGVVDVVFVEGDVHAVDDPDLVIYLHLPDEQRLQNRIERDVVMRGGDVDKTTASFNFRQKAQHMKYTLATAEQADFVVMADGSAEQRSFDLYQAKA